MTAIAMWVALLSTTVTGLPPAGEAAPLTHDDARWSAWRGTDYVLLAPAAWLAAAEPLAAHRRALGHRVATVPVEALAADGRPAAPAIERFLADLDARAGGTLRYVLLAADVDAPAAAPIPARYDRKLVYRGRWGGGRFPTDRGYAEAIAGKTLAVGRIPAQSAADLRAAVAKIVRYETTAAPGHWQRRVTVTAGQARYGALVDTALAGLAKRVLDDAVPYDYDVDFTFADPRSPWTYRPDALGDKLVEGLNRGALFAAYVGHGGPDGFDDVSFRGRHHRIGSLADLAGLDSQQGGHPFFVSVTCSTGRFDGHGGRQSMAEAMALHPDGPIASWAGSRVTHPYPNGLLAQAFAEVFLQGRPETLGEGLLAVHDKAPRYRQPLMEALGVRDAVGLLDEHRGLYNLFGDPATRLRYPKAVQVRVASPGPDGRLAVTVTAAAVAAGRVLATLETRRAVVQHALVGWADLQALPLDAAYRAMADNHAKANDKVVATARALLRDGRATVTLAAPPDGARYVVKVLVAGADGLAAGHAEVPGEALVAKR